MATVLINGNADVAIDYLDRGFLYGDGLFETIAYKNSKLIYWKEHYARLCAGCRRLGLPIIEEQQWLADIEQLSLVNKSHVVKLMLTRGPGGRGYKYDAMNPTRVVACYDWPDYPKSHEKEGIKLRICETGISVNPSLAGIKHMNRLDNVLARNEWSDDSVAEGLMLDDMAYVIEGTMSNVFAVKGDALYTPDISRAGVEGVVRNRLLTIAKEQGMVVYETNITRSQLLEMDEVFITNSLIGIWPVRYLENVEYKKRAVTENMIHNLGRDEIGHAV